MKKLFIITLCLIYPYIVAFAQRPGDIPQGAYNELVKFDDRVKHLHGSNYLLDDWNEGKISVHYKDSTRTFSPLRLRYDIANQLVEVKIKNTLSGKTSVKTFDDRYLVKFQYRSKDKKIHSFERCKSFKMSIPLNGFFNILYQGKKVNFLARNTNYVQKGNEFRTLGVGSADDRIIQKTEFYMTKEGKTYKIKRRRKFILTQLGDKKNEIKAFAKENNLYYKSKKDLMAIFKYYDGL